ncbi:rhomboid family intramembrane serine protease [Kibdelosporangium aridum]|uniref:Rhomboid family intramembrane serine protease n=1 Tax=Kibdelosporangium aridum TaxID=2030 RepID=A0A428Z8W0_KIBAR|nr:rhomboid family intramembrane serine protease [Kibdelosporangium aridum]RSM84486.1 rhomboid family intramembrane serine protease [Kibdelosporangium aridum]
MADEVCVRHPDRPTGLRCVRCERPSCPECLREASVGYQCVDCVNEGRRTQRRAVTVAGAELNTKPIVMPILLLLNVAVFALTAAQAQSITNNQFSYPFELGVLYPPAVAGGEWWRLITNGFLHYGVIHLVVNMVSLYIVGRDLEMLFGRVRFLALYLVALLGGSVMVFLFDPETASQTSTGRVVVDYGFTAGASGAIFGLMGALAVAVFRLKLPIAPALGIIALNLVFTFTIANISIFGHIGGLITGAAVALGFLYPPAKIRTKVQVATLVAALVVLVGLVFVRDSGFDRPATCVHENSQVSCYRQVSST